MPTNGFSIKPLKVQLLAGEQKATEKRGPCLVSCGLVGEVLDDPRDSKSIAELHVHRQNVAIHSCVRACICTSRIELAWANLQLFLSLKPIQAVQIVLVNGSSRPGHSNLADAAPLETP